jgi:hypothetical protein
VSGRSLAAFIGCGRASTVTGERECGGAGKLTAKSVQQPLRDCVMHARRREGEKQ